MTHSRSHSAPTEESRGDHAALIAAAAVQVDGIVRMHGGGVGAVATYHSGGRVVGVRFTDDRVEVHVVAEFGRSIPDLAEDVRDHLEPISGFPVDVFIEDIFVPGVDASLEGVTSSAGSTAVASKPRRAIQTGGSTE